MEDYKKLQELKELILAENPESIWYDGQNEQWYVDTSWLGKGVGSLFEGKDVNECLEKMHEYFLEHMDHDDFAGMKITQSGYPDLAKVRIYLKNKREEELNLVEILKDAPKGTRLYSPLFDKEVVLDKVDGDKIHVLTKESNKFGYDFYERGNFFRDEGECLLFPSKENRDWSTFEVKKEESLKVGDHVKEGDSNNVLKMNEKIKGVIVSSETKFHELICWLRSQGAVESSLATLVTVVRSAIYYVNKQGQAMYVDKIHADLFDIVELPEWRAEKDEAYYYVSDTGKCCVSYEGYMDLDAEKYECGNYFKTKEEAEKYAEKIREIFKRKEDNK